MTGGAVSDVEADQPKHPYVTQANAKFHLVMSIIAAVLATIQVILGIIDSETVVKNMKSNSWAGEEDAWYYGSRTGYSNRHLFGETIWIAAVGYMMAALGFSVYRTRSRPNGVMLSTMTLISGFVIYPVAVGLSLGLSNDLESGLSNIRYVTSVALCIQLIFMLVWGFYTSCHACCNSHVRRSRQLHQTTGAATVALPQQPQMMFVTTQAPQPQYIQQPPMYTPGAVQVAPVPLEVAHGGAPPPIPADSPPTYSS